MLRALQMVELIKIYRAPHETSHDKKKGKKRAMLQQVYGKEAIDPTKIAKYNEEKASSSASVIYPVSRTTRLVSQSTPLSNTNEIFFGNVNDVIDIASLKNVLVTSIEKNDFATKLHQKIQSKLQDTERLEYRIREELRDLPGIKELKEVWKKQIETMSGKKITETRPGHFDFILRLSNTIEQPEHQESPSNLGVKEWQVLMALHTSSLSSTTTAIKYDEEYIGLNLDPGDYVILSGDIWHFGTKVASMSQDSWNIRGLPYMPLFTCYFKEV